MSRLDTRYPIENVALELIDADLAANSRDEIGDIAGLTLSVQAAKGNRTPGGLRKKKNGRYTVVWGFRRHAACLEAEGVDEFLAEVFPEKLNKGESLLLNGQENMAREPLNPMEEANLIVNLRKAGYSDEDIQENLGVSSTLITQRVALTETPEAVQIALGAGKITVAQARALAPLPDGLTERYVDVAASLPVEKLKVLVEKEVAKVKAAENPEPPETEEPEPETEETPEPEEDEGETEAAQCVSLFSDVVAKILGGDDEEAIKAASSSIFEVGTLEFDTLPGEDQTMLLGILESLVEKLDCKGAADEYDIEPTDGDDPEPEIEADPLEENL